MQPFYDGMAFKVDSILGHDGIYHDLPCQGAMKRAGGIGTRTATNPKFVVWGAFSVASFVGAAVSRPFVLAQFLIFHCNVLLGIKSEGPRGLPVTGQNGLLASICCKTADRSKWCPYLLNTGSFMICLVMEQTNSEGSCSAAVDAIMMTVMMKKTMTGNVGLACAFFSSFKLLLRSFLRYVIVLSTTLPFLGGYRWICSLIHSDFLVASASRTTLSESLRNVT
jgi:hypothetical protein